MPNAYYVYAIVRRDIRLPAANLGSRPAELTMVPWRELAAVTAPTGGNGPPVTTEAMLNHEAVVEAVRQQGPALPVRFGTVFPDATSVASALAERYEPLSADLDHLGDKVELSLTALWAEPGSGDGPAPARQDEEVPAGQSEGARYLRARAATLRRDETLKERARMVAQNLDQVLGARALERRVSLVPTPRVAVRTAYLLDLESVGGFRAVFEAMHRGQRDVRLLLTGPWPPYSFVRRPDTDSGAAGDDHLARLAHILSDAMREPG